MHSRARFILLLAIAVLSFAQAPKHQAPPGVIRSVQITGNQIYPSEDIVKALGLKPGDPASPSILEAARQKVQALDVFSTVSFRFKFDAATPSNYDVLFTVAEDTQVLPMHFERLGAAPADILAYLKTHVQFFSEQIPGTASIVQRYRKSVQDYLDENVKNPVRVRANVATDEAGKLQVNFFPDAPIPTISQVDVTGNEAVDKGTILRAANDVGIGVPLTDARIKLILEGAIRPVYAARGYPLVTFPKVETEPAKTNSGVILKVTIHEGPKFNFGPLRFRGKGLEEDEIRTALTFKPGDPYSSDKVDAFRVELLHKMHRKGLLDATIDPETSPDEEKHIMNVIYNVVPGEIYKFQKLDIIGLDVTAQPAIEKLWGEKPGQTFNPDYPDFFLKKVSEQGLFDNLAGTHSDYTPDAASHNVTVHLYFKGGKSPEEKKREKKEEEDKRNGPPYGE